MPNEDEVTAVIQPLLAMNRGKKIRCYEKNPLRYEAAENSPLLQTCTHYGC